MTAPQLPGGREPGDDSDEEPVTRVLPSGVTEIEPWKSMLETRNDPKTGEPRLVPNIKNVTLLLTHDASFKGCLAFNELKRSVELIKKMPHMVGFAPAKKDALDSYIRDSVIVALSHINKLNIGKELAADAIEFAARQRRFNPFRDYLDALKWDGTPRLDSWLSTYLGVLATPYSKAVGRWWLVSLIARTYKPGCQADHLLVLEGPQGRGKSSALRILFGDDYFTDEMPDLGTKDALQHIAGMVGVELGELDALSRHEVTRVKAFLTVRSDRYRPAFERYVINAPRTCVFAGTTNSDGYLKDDTGNRRFWPVRVGRIDLAALAAERDMLLAEARLAFEGGSRWHPTTELASAIHGEQEARFQRDEWEPRVEAWVSDQGNEIDLGAVLSGPLGLEPGKWGQGEQKRAASCLRRLGYERRQVRAGSKVHWRWVLPSPPEPDVTPSPAVTDAEDDPGDSV